MRKDTAANVLRARYGTNKSSFNSGEQSNATAPVPATWPNLCGERRADAFVYKNDTAKDIAVAPK